MTHIHQQHNFMCMLCTHTHTHTQRTTITSILSCTMTHIQNTPRINKHKHTHLQSWPITYTHTIMNHDPHIYKLTEGEPLPPPPTPIQNHMNHDSPLHLPVTAPCSPLEHGSLGDVEYLGVPYRVFKRRKWKMVIIITQCEKNIWDSDKSFIGWSTGHH